MEHNNDSEHTKEHKKANEKIVDIGGEKKLLLMDDDELIEMEGENISESDLEEYISQALSETIHGDGVDNEELNEGIIDEANYPENFSIKDFKAQRSFAARVRYAKSHLGNISSGSSRVVLGIDKSTVMKIAKNVKGLAQNEAEVDVSNIGYDIIAEVFDFDDEKYLYVEMERARKMKKSDWKKLTGWKFNDWMEAFYYYIEDRKGRGRYKHMLPENFEELEETELFSDLVGLLADFGMPSGDLIRVSSWGIVNRHGKDIPVLVDYGLTEDIRREHYM